MHSPCRAKLACIVFRNKTILSVGHNRYTLRTMPSEKYTIHAEMDAYRKCASRKAVSLLIVRIGADGQLRHAKPCAHCCQALRESMVKNVYYSNEQGVICLLRRRDLHSTFVSSGNRQTKCEHETGRSRQQDEHPQHRHATIIV